MSHGKTLKILLEAKVAKPVWKNKKKQNKPADPVNKEFSYERETSSSLV